MKKIKSKKALIGFVCLLFASEAGFDPGTAILLGSSLAGLFGGSKSKKQTFQEPYPGYNDSVQSVLGLAKSKMNTPAPTYTSMGGTFDLQPSAIQTATTDSILGNIKNPVKPQTYSSDITDKYYNAHKARVGQEYDTMRQQESDRYNKLGLLTSTPGLQAQHQINKEQELTNEDISSQLMYEDIARELQAQQLADQINQEYLSKGMVLGQQDYANQQYTNNAGYQDFVHSQDTPLNYARLAAGVLGGSSPTPQQSYPDLLSNLSMTGMDIGTLMMMSNILGNKNAAGNPTNSGASTGFGGVNIASPYYTPLSLRSN